MHSSIGKQATIEKKQSNYKLNSGVQQTPAYHVVTYDAYRVKNVFNPLIFSLD